jgi:NADPH-dependent ferric siderophore reductase
VTQVNIILLPSNRGERNVFLLVNDITNRKRQAMTTQEEQRFDAAVLAATEAALAALANTLEHLTAEQREDIRLSIYSAINACAGEYVFVS